MLVTSKLYTSIATALLLRLKQLFSESFLCYGWAFSGSPMTC